MRLGIGSYTYTWAIGVAGHPPKVALTPFDLLERASRLGIKVVQFCDNLPLTELSAKDLDRFDQERRQRDIQIELGTRGLDAGNLQQYLALCQRLGSPILRLVIDRAGDEPSAEEALNRLKPLVRDCAAAGVRLAIENHDRFSSGTLADLVEQLGRRYVGICLDTVNSFGALEGPDVVVRRLGEYVVCLHVKDFTIRRVSHSMGFVVEGCAAGQGRLDVPWLLTQLKGCPNPFNAILETWVTPSDSLQETIERERTWAEQGVAYLRRFIPG